MRFLKYLGCLTVVFLCLTGCGAAKGTPVSTATSPAAETPAQEAGTTGVVKKIDTAAQKITFYNVSFNTVEEYTCVIANGIKPINITSIYCMP